ncbi:MAG: PIG-L family deacetylase [Brevundimonas sp.]|nr:MAG: PIG-L family deacetylase [Brevundimonas sp.]
MIDPLTLPARRLLVVAPHPDDESLGCGGLIHAFVRDGRAVTVAFVTDGGASHPGSLAWSRRRLAARRRDEALDALQALGLSRADGLFLDLPDSDMPAPGSAADRVACDRLAALVRAFDPDLTLLPWRRDPHRDHRDAWRLGRVALAATGSSSGVLEYAVWLDELGAPADRPRPQEADAVVFDVTSGLAAKRAAVAAHLSQTTALIEDDPTGFRLAEATLQRLCGPAERYWRPRP